MPREAFQSPVYLARQLRAQEQQSATVRGSVEEELRTLIEALQSQVTALELWKTDAENRISALESA